MKKLILPVAILLLATSCKKNIGDIEPSAGEISLSFIDDSQSPQSKAFFDPSTTAEAWESSLSSLAVLVFDQGGKLLVHRNFNPAEVAAKSANFAIPNTTAGTTCDFYAVANVAVPVSVTNKAQLLAMLENTPAVYNGTFAQTTSQAMRPGGFVMSGKTTKDIGAAGTRTAVALTLYRTVSKIAVRTATTPEFNTRYLGALRVDNITISKAASQSNIIAPTTVNPGTLNFTSTQTPGTNAKEFHNLFYIHENGVLATGNRILLTIAGTYDRDGNFTTNTDQAPVTYTVELNGSGNGDIARNGYYRIDVKVDGLTGADASATISVSPWSSPITQTVNVGQ